MATRSSSAATRERKENGRRATSHSNGQAAVAGRPTDGAAVDPRALQELVDALDAARRGDFSVRLSKRRKGVMGEVAASAN